MIFSIIAFLSVAFIPKKKIRVPETMTDTMQVEKKHGTVFENNFPQSKVAEEETATIKIGVRTESRKNRRTAKPKYFFESRTRIANAAQFKAILM